MIVGPTPLRPMKLALGVRDRQVVYGGDAAAHEAGLVELPVLVAIGTKPMAAVVAPFIGEAHGDAVEVEGPDLLDQAIFDLARPFAREKRLDLGATLK